jgi:polysaccharide biosynthesis transport protein
MSTVESNVHLEEYLDFQKYWLVMKRRWLPATATLIGVVGLSLIYAFSLKPIYEGEAKLLIQTDRSANFTGIENETGQIDVTSENSDPLATEAEILLSRPLVEQLIQKLDLQDDTGEAIEYKRMLDVLTVETVVGTDILEITYENNDPELAVSVINEIIKLYREQDTLSNRTEAAAARTFITEQLPQVEVSVKQAENKLREFKNKYGIANLTEETSATISSQSSLENQIDALEAELEDVSTRYNQLNSELGVSWQEASAIATLSQSLAVQTTSERLQETKLELTQKRNYLSESTPQVISLREEVAELEQLLDREVERTLGSKQKALLKDLNILALEDLRQGQMSEFADLGLQREGLQKKLAALNSIYSSNQQKSSILPQLEEQQKELERRVEAAQSTYETLLGKLQETRIAEEQDIGKVRVVAEAVVPEHPVGPSKKKIVAAGGILGTLLGIAVAFLLDIRDNTIKNTKEAEEILPYPLQGVIPNFKSLDRGKQEQLPEDTSLATSRTQTLAIREAYQNIQVNLKFLEGQEAIKTIAVTSAVAREGKTSVSANYAAAQAQCGKRVLLIDGDLRCPSQHKRWQISNQVGLSNVLHQEVEWYDVVQNVLPNLDVLTAGTVPDNPVVLLDSLSMGLIVMKIIAHYDLIIFDTPPLVGLADSKIIGKLVDGMLFVVRPGVANYSSVLAAKKILENKELNVLGVVANGVNVSQEPYGNEYYSVDKKYLESVN